MILVFYDVYFLLTTFLAFVSPVSPDSTLFSTDLSMPKPTSSVLSALITTFIYP